MLLLGANSAPVKILQMGKAIIGPYPGLGWPLFRKGGGINWLVLTGFQGPKKGTEP